MGLCQQVTLTKSCLVALELVTPSWDRGKLLTSMLMVCNPVCSLVQLCSRSYHSQFVCVLCYPSEYFPLHLDAQDNTCNCHRIVIFGGKVDIT